MGTGKDMGQGKGEAGDKVAADRVVDRRADHTTVAARMAAVDMTVAAHRAAAYRVADMVSAFAHRAAVIAHTMVVDHKRAAVVVLAHKAVLRRNIHMDTTPSLIIHR